MKITGKKNLVTGGATGIGLGMVAQFLADNNTVIICGRRPEVLAEAQKTHPTLITHPCDLSSAKEREALYQWLAANHSDLEVLVNNAGIQNWMHIAEDDFMTRAQQEIQTNIEAPIHLTKLLLQLPAITIIMNVTSGLSFMPLAKVGVYSATKAFMHSFTLSLRHMLRDRHIRVIEVIPPALNTDLGGKGLHDAAPPVQDFIHAIFLQIAEGKDELTWGFSEKMHQATPAEIKATFDKMNG